MTTPHSPHHRPWGTAGRMTGAPCGQSGPGAGCEGRGSQLQGALENSKTTCDKPHVVNAVSTRQGSSGWGAGMELT